jgi:hypothetical protein
MMIYKFAFYKLYVWNLRAFGNKDLPELNALLMLSIFEIFNLITLVMLTDYLFKTQILKFVVMENGLK